MTDEIKGQLAVLVNELADIRFGLGTLVDELLDLRDHVVALERHLASTVSAGFVRRPPKETVLKWVPPL